MFGIKLEVAEYKHYIFLWSAWDDTSGSMTSLSQSIWYVYWTVESNTRGEGDDLISSMSRSWQASQWIMIDCIHLLLVSRERHVCVKADR